MMKFLFAGVLALFTLLATAQTEAGGWLVGATSDLSFISTSIDGQQENDSEFSLETQAGYFVADNFNVGLLVAFNSAKDGFSTLRTTSTVIGPFARYYVGGQFFIGAAYGITSVSIEDENGNELGDANGGTIIFEAGYPIWIVDNVAIEPGLGYTFGSGDFDTFSAFGLNIGFNLYF